MSIFKKSKLFLVAAAIISSFAFASVSSAASAEASVAIVDTQKILEESTAVKDIRTQVDKKAESFKADSVKKETYFKTKYEELEKKKSVLSKEAFEKKSEELAKEFAEAQKNVQEHRGTLDKGYVEAMQKFDNAFLDTVKSVSKKHGHTLVLHKMQTIYSENALDITDEVLTGVNKRMSKVRVKF